MRQTHIPSKLSQSSSAIRRLRAIRSETLSLGIITVGLALFQVFLNYARVAYHIPFLALLQGAFIYFPAIIFPRRFGWTAAVVFTGTSFAVNELGAPPDPFTVGRVAIFSLVLGFTAGFRRPPPPVVVLGMSWTALILLFLLAPLGNKPSITGKLAQLAPLAAAELTWSLMLGLLRLSPWLNSLLTGTKQSYTVRVVLIQIMILVTFLSTGAFSLLLLWAHGETLLSFIPKLAGHEGEIVLAFGVLLGFPTLIGFLLTRALTQFFQNLREAALPSSRLRLNPPHPLPILEFLEAAREARALGLKNEADTRERLQQVKNLTLNVAELKEELGRVHAKLADLYKLLDLCPWGFLGVNATGIILHYNQPLRELLEIKDETVVGKHFSDLHADHPWYREISALLSLACTNTAKLSSHHVSRCASSSVDGSYLELVLTVLDPSAPFAGTRDGAPPPEFGSKCALMLSCRRLPDLRDYELNLMLPSSLELVGSQAREICGIVNRQLLTINRHIETTTSPLVEGAGPPVDPEEKALEAMLLLKNIERTLKKLIGLLAPILKEGAPSDTPKEAVNMSRLLRDLLDHFGELLSLEEPLQFTTVPEARTLEGGESSQDFASEPVADATVVACPTELSRFSAYFLSLIRSILPKASHPSVSVGCETISPTTAAIIPGSRPGRFCRIVLRHSGQTITANMVGGKLSHYDNRLPEEESTETALNALVLQIKRLGGFFSIQSSAAKGTELTIYLPADPESINVRDKTREAQGQNSSLGVLEEARQRALVVGPHDATVASLESMLRDLGYTANIQQPADLVTTAEPDHLEFRGIGFETENCSTHEHDLPVALHPAKAQALAEVPFDVLILMADESPTARVHLLEQLQQIQPKACTIVVTDPDHAEERLPRGVQKLIKPFDLASLRSTLEHARHFHAEQASD